MRSVHAHTLRLDIVERAGHLKYQVELFFEALVSRE